jgi:hypothetical protein
MKKVKGPEEWVGARTHTFAKNGWGMESRLSKGVKGGGLPLPVYHSDGYGHSRSGGGISAHLRAISADE